MFPFLYSNCPLFVIIFFLNPFFSSGLIISWICSCGVTWLQVLSDEILQLVSTVSLTGWYDTAALRTTSYLFAFSHHRVAFLSQPVFYQAVTTVTGRISGKWAHVRTSSSHFVKPVKVVPTPKYL